MINLSNEGFAHCEQLMKTNNRDFFKTMHLSGSDSSLLGKIYERSRGVFDYKVFDRLYTARNYRFKNQNREKMWGW
jgi:hypothetical protein